LLAAGFDTPAIMTSVVCDPSEHPNELRRAAWRAFASLGVPDGEDMVVFGLFISFGADRRRGGGRQRWPGPPSRPWRAHPDDLLITAGTGRCCRRHFVALVHGRECCLRHRNRLGRLDTHEALTVATWAGL